MTTRFDRLGKLVRRGGRSPVVTGGAAPTITVAPVLAWTVEIGNSPTLTDPVYTGDAGTITWTLYRDGVADGTIANVSKATAEAYAAVAADIGPDLHFEATVTNGSGSDSDVTNTVVFNDATYLPDTAIWVSTAGLTLADSDTTVDSWVSSLGGLSGTVSAPTAGVRPSYSASGGAGSRPLVTFDGVNDTLSDNAFVRGATWTDFEGGAVGEMLSGNTNGDIVLEYYTASGRYRPVQRIGTGQRVNASILGGSAGTTTWTASNDNVTGHFSGDWDGADLSVRLAGAVQSTVATAGVSLPDSGKVVLGSFNAGASSWAAFTCQAAYAGGYLTADQRTHLRALLTYHTGVAC